MNKIIVARFESYQQLLIKSLAISHFVIAKQNLYSNRGHIRVKATLVDNGLLEFSEYLIFSDALPVERSYSFHWQDAQQQLVKRWDNATHHPHLPHSPHHIHQSDGTVAGNPEPPTLPGILSEIERLVI